MALANIIVVGLLVLLVLILSMGPKAAAGLLLDIAFQIVRAALMTIIAFFRWRK